MSNQNLKLTVLLASVRQGRFGPVVARWFLGEAQRHGGFDVGLVDLAEVPLPLSLPAVPPRGAKAYPRPPEMAGLTAALEAADAFVVVTPEYNHSFPASIKCLIDWHYTQWQAKPVGFVSYGGPGGGVRAVEQLRLVFAELHAVAVREAVALPWARELFDEGGRPKAPDGPGAAAKAVLDRLAWWGRVLHDARRDRPYEA